MLVNSPRLGAALAEVLGVNETQPTSPLHTVALQRGHGFITVATSIEQATDYAYYAQSNAKVQTNALLMNAAAAQYGSLVQYLSAAERKDCKNMNAWIAFKPWKQWVREVERDPTYTNTLGSPPGA
jgi:ribulose-5-phosphate 4-epimerase/fuculose-1-phosphate aldolase